MIRCRCIPDLSDFKIFIEIEFNFFKLIVGVRIIVKHSFVKEDMLDVSTTLNN